MSTPPSESTSTIEHVLVVRRTEQAVEMAEGRGIWWHDIVARQDAACEPEPMDSEDKMLYLLYTLGVRRAEGIEQYDELVRRKRGMAMARTGSVRWSFLGRDERENCSLVRVSRSEMSSGL